MAQRTVEVFDRHGHLVHSHTIALEHEYCLDIEYEEVALIFTECSGIVAKTEHVHLRARCVD